MKGIFLLSLCSFFVITGCDQGINPIDPQLHGTWELTRVKVASNPGTATFWTPEEYGRLITVIFLSDGRFEMTYKFPDYSNQAEGTYDTDNNTWLNLNFSTGESYRSHYHVTENSLDFQVDLAFMAVPHVWEFIRVGESYEKLHLRQK